MTDMQKLKEMRLKYRITKAHLNCPKLLTNRTQQP